MAKIPQTQLGNRGEATAPLPSVTLGGGATRSKYNTYITQPPAPGQQPRAIYEGDRLWAVVTLTLETAGPVAVSDMPNLFPVLSGKGLLLPTGQPMQFKIAKGTRLYVAATAVNRIKVQIDPVPWLEQIAGTLMLIAGKVLGRIPGVSASQTDAPEALPLATRRR